MPQKEPTPRTLALLERIVRPGDHKLEFYARWGTEIESGEMSRAAARFWSQRGRQELLRPCWPMEECLEDWDDEEHGDRPEEGTEEWLDGEALSSGECSFIYQNAEIILPEAIFAEPLSGPDFQLSHSGEREEELRTIPLYELLTQTDCAHFDRVAYSALYPDVPPSGWQVINGWKGNFGTCTITVDDEMTLRELLCAQPIYGRVWVDTRGDDYHFDVLNFGDEEVEWENSNGKSTEVEVAPPDNMRLWRVGGVAIGRLMGLLRRASERVYAPGGTGVESVRREFEALAKGS